MILYCNAFPCFRIPRVLATFSGPDLKRSETAKFYHLVFKKSALHFTEKEVNDGVDVSLADTHLFTDALDDLRLGELGIGHVIPPGSGSNPVHLDGHTRLPACRSVLMIHTLAGCGVNEARKGLERGGSSILVFLFYSAQNTLGARSDLTSYDSVL